MSSINLCSYHSLLASNSALYVESYKSWKMSLNRPSYFFKIVFLVLKYNGIFRSRAYLKEEWAKSMMLSSRLNIPMATPDPLYSLTTCVIVSLPSLGTKVIVRRPADGTKKSVARYWSPKACLPMMIGFSQPGTSRGIFLQIMASRKTVPPRMFLIVPFGDFHICFKPNSSTLASSGVMVAHLIPTLYCLMAFAQSMVTWSFVSSRYSIPRSNVFNSMSKKGRINLSLMESQMIRVISSPNTSTTVPALIFGDIFIAFFKCTQPI